MVAGPVGSGCGNCEQINALKHEISCLIAVVLRFSMYWHEKQEQTGGKRSLYELMKIVSPEEAERLGEEAVNSFPEPSEGSVVAFANSVGITKEEVYGSSKGQ